MLDDSTVYLYDVDDTLRAMHLPISLNTQFEVYKHLKHSENDDVFYRIGSVGDIVLFLRKNDVGYVKLRISYDVERDPEPDLQGHGFCIHGLIPGAYLHTEETVYPPPPLGPS